MINKAENYPKKRNLRENLHPEHQPKTPKSKNSRLKFTKKKTGKSTQRRSVKRPKKAKIKDKITQKAKFQVKNG